VSLADRKPPQEGPGWHECGTGWLLKQLTPDDAETVRQWLASGTPAPWIAEQVEDETGIPVTAESLRRHRLGRCKC